MEFSEHYLTYEEYRALGGTLDLMPFNLLEFEAKNLIDLNTQNRLINIDDIPQKVKICVFHLINKIESYTSVSEGASGNIASENTDGYSVSYITANQLQDVIKSKNVEFEDLILKDLYGVVVNNEHIIFNGVK